MYYDYLKQLLEPLRLYDLENGAGAEELKVIGSQLDEIFEELEELYAEALPATAQSFGLRKYEKLLPYRPAYLTTQDAQRALMALMRIRGGCFTIGMLQDTLSGCGLNAIVAEGREPLTAIVSFPDNRGIPEGFEKLKFRVEEIMPCHLAVKYAFVYTLWRELMEKLSDWQVVENSVNTWRELEIYM